MSTPAGDERRFDTSDADAREDGIGQAARMLHRGRLAVFPTDTVYGVAADAFNAEAVARLLAAKGRGRQMPPPVLISAKETLRALSATVPPWVDALIEDLWPGPLTVILRSQPSLQWDLGETKGTVAVRMPDHPVALELISRTGPLAVSSANRTGMPAAQTADEAQEMLGDSVRVYLDGGPTPGPVASTIIDCTGDESVPVKVLRLGVVPVTRLNEIVADWDITVTDEAGSPEQGAG